MPLTEPEVDQFLAEPHIAVVATSGPAGKPHAMPIWYLWKDGKVLFHTGSESKKLRNLRRNARVSLVVDTKVAPYKVVVVEGTARELAGDRDLARDIAVHYLGQVQGERYASRSGEPGSLVEITPTRVISWDYAKESNP